MSVLEFKNISYSYEGDEDKCVALSDISFSVEEGEFIVLCGGNGSGKSTLAKLCNGLLTPEAGLITAFGKPINYDDEQSLYELRSKVGLVFQNPDNQTVASIIEDDIAFGPENLGVPPQEIEQRITRALEAVDMSEYRKHSASKLSGGQKQRAAIAGILAMEPNVLVCDESTAMLDPCGRQEVMQTLSFLNKTRGITVIHVTHHMEECAYAGRALVLKQGRLVFDGLPETLFSDYEFVRNCSLELPVLQYVIYLLRKRGIPVSDNCKSEKELANELWLLKRKI